VTGAIDEVEKPLQNGAQQPRNARRLKDADSGESVCVKPVHVVTLTRAPGAGRLKQRRALAAAHSPRRRASLLSALASASGSVLLEFGHPLLVPDRVAMNRVLKPLHKRLQMVQPLLDSPQIARCRARVWRDGDAAAHARDLRPGCGGSLEAVARAEEIIGLRTLRTRPHDPSDDRRSRPRDDRPKRRRTHPATAIHTIGATPR
jgi:hypothetical protein